MQIKILRMLYTFIIVLLLPLHYENSLFYNFVTWMSQAIQKIRTPLNITSVKDIYLRNEHK